MSSTTTTTEAELQSFPISRLDSRAPGSRLSLAPSSQSSHPPQQDTPRTLQPEDGPEVDDSSNIATALPDGGYGWTIVFSSAVLNFFCNGFTGSWGVLQTALLQSDLKGFSASTVSWVGSLSIAMVVGLGLFGVRLIPALGARNTTILGGLLLTAGSFGSGFTTGNLPGLFVTVGFLIGSGICLLLVISNTIPTQYFNGSLGGKLGLANGIIKLGGGIGATVLSVALEALNRKVGIAWTFRIYGFMNLAIALPATWLIRERVPSRKTPLVDLSLFRSLPYTAVFLAGAIGVFALYVPPFFLPLFANSIGLSSSTGAGIVAGFNLSAAVGRFGAGPLCDRIGAVNTFLITMVLNALSMLAIWPVSESLAPLVVFAVLNGVANGAFFTSIPTVITTMVGPGKAAIAMSTGMTGWTAGYLLGSPIAGYLLQSSKNGRPTSVDTYRPAILYAGGVALAASAFVVFARFKLSKQWTKKV